MKISNVEVTRTRLKLFFLWLFYEPLSSLWATVKIVFRFFISLRKPSVWLQVYCLMFFVYLFWDLLTKDTLILRLLKSLRGGMREDYSHLGLWILGFIFIIFWNLWASQDFLRWAKKR